MDPSAIGLAKGTGFCCPRCRGPLAAVPKAYRCPACRREFPIVCGIPDFRLSPDPYISVEDEYQKVGVLADMAGRVSFENLLRFYWEITPDVPRPAAERYIRYALNGERRGDACLQAIDAYRGGRWTGRSCLDLGCGTGGFLFAARRRFSTVVGTDIALRWLILAQKRMADAGGDSLLVCCSAAHLPFADGTFDGVVGLHMLEHAQDPQAVLSDAARALKHAGLCFFSTPNRFSLGPEPCVRVWGVGFLPRPLASGYVRLLRGTPYRHIRLLSYFELRRFVARSGLREWTISPPRIADFEQRVVSAFARALIIAYHALRELRAFRALLNVFGPFLQVIGRKRTAERD